MAVIESILRTTSKLVGISADETHFDDVLLPHINTALMNLSQLGIGPSTGFSITGEDEKWSDYLGTTFQNIEGVKNYIFIYTKLQFDPPSTSYVLEAMERNLREIEYRLKIQVEPDPIADEESIE